MPSDTRALAGSGPFPRTHSENLLTVRIIGHPGGHIRFSLPGSASDPKGPHHRRIRHTITMLALVAALAAVALPASADHSTTGNATGAPDRFLDGAGVLSGGEITYGSVYDLNANMTGRASVTDTVSLIDPAGTARAHVAARQRDGAGSPGQHGIWATFPAALIDIAGEWRVSGSGGDIPFRGQVREDLTVSIAPAVVTFERATKWYTISVFQGSAPVNDATIWMPGLGASGWKQDAGTDGQYPILINLSVLGAGSHPIHAYRSTAGGPPVLSGGTVTGAESTGSGVFVIQPQPVNVARKSGTERAGGDDSLTLSVTFPGTSVDVLAQSPAGTTEVTLTFPDHRQAHYTFHGPGAANPRQVDGSPAPYAGAMSLGSGGDLTYSPTGAEPGQAHWAAGIHEWSVTNDRFGGSDPEYVGTFTLSLPAAERVVVSVTPTSDKVPAPVPDSESPTAAGTVSVTLTIRGGDPGTHPGNADGPFDSGNITIRGDVLPGSANVQGAGDTWQVAFTPERGLAHVTFDINWRGESQAVAWDATAQPGSGAPSAGGPGSRITTDTTHVVQYAPTTATYRLATATGTPVTTGAVALFDETGHLTTVHGDGSPGRGANGNYELTFTPRGGSGTHVVAVGSYGAAPHWNHSYTAIALIPGAALVAGLDPAEVLAGLPIEVAATVKEGGTYPTGRQYNFYLVDTKTLTALHSLTGDQSRIRADVPAEWKRLGQPANTSFPYTGSVAEGPRHLFVETADGHLTNLRGEPRLWPAKADVTVSPGFVVQGTTIDDDARATFTVRGPGGVPAQGMLTVEGGSIRVIDNTSPAADTVRIVDGVGTAQVIDGGDVPSTFSFTPGGGTMQPASGSLAVFLPAAAVEPVVGRVGVPMDVAVQLTGPSGNPIVQGTNVALCGNPVSATGGCTPEVRSGPTGRATVPIFPIKAGTLTVHVNGASTSTALTVVPHVVITVDADEVILGDTITFRVTTDGGPVAGATIRVAGPGSDPETLTTGPDGRAIMETTRAGDHAATTAAEGGDVRVAFRVVEHPPPEPVEPEVARFEIDDPRLEPRNITLGDSFVAEVTVRNVGTANGVATLVLLLDGRAIAQVNSAILPPGAAERRVEDHAPQETGTFRIALGLTGAATIDLGSVTVHAATATGDDDGDDPSIGRGALNGNATDDPDPGTNESFRAGNETPRGHETQGTPLSLTPAPGLPGVVGALVVGAVWMRKHAKGGR